MAVYNPEGLHKEFQNSFNAGNLDAVMDLYEADATLVPIPLPFLVAPRILSAQSSQEVSSCRSSVWLI